jgi:hypothetical protein
MKVSFPLVGKRWSYVIASCACELKLLDFDFCKYIKSAVYGDTGHVDSGET